MGWENRDYARGNAGGRGPSWRGPGSSRLIGGSIVTTLIAVNVGVYVLATMISPSQLGPAIYEWGVLQAKAVMHGEVWRLITTQYLHDPSGFGHIFINMLGLHFLGRPLERMWSAKKFFWVYTVAGLAGSIFFTILGSLGWINPYMPAVGASGCLFGILGIVAVLFPTATVYIYFLFPLKIRTAAMLFGAYAVMKVLSQGANYGGEACHLAGLVFGVWWAKKGDMWWSTTEWRIPRGKPRTARPRKAPRSTFTEKVVQRRADAGEIDRILRKVYDGGVHTLTASEKKTLGEATERQRREEASAGRVDRL